MIIEIDAHLIETDDITNITPVYCNGEECSFRVYMPISYVVVRGEELEVAEKRDRVVKLWTKNNGALPI